MPLWIAYAKSIGHECRGSEITSPFGVKTKTSSATRPVFRESRYSFASFDSPCQSRICRSQVSYGRKACEKTAVIRDNRFNTCLLKHCFTDPGLVRVMNTPPWHGTRTAIIPFQQRSGDFTTEIHARICPFDFRIMNTDPVNPEGQMDCNTTDRNDKSKKLEENQRIQQIIVEIQRKAMNIRIRITCVKGANAIYYIRLLALAHDEC